MEDQEGQVEDQVEDKESKTEAADNADSPEAPESPESPESPKGEEGEEEVEIIVLSENDDDIEDDDDEAEAATDDPEKPMARQDKSVISQMLGDETEEEEAVAEDTETSKKTLEELAQEVDDGVEKPRVDISHPLAQDIILHPTQWLIWPAVAVLRWLLRRAAKEARRVVYRSEPTLNFPASEIRDIAVDADGIELILSAPGIAVAGSALPSSDIARIVRDKRNGGALSDWLDGIGDRFMHALETSQGRTNPAFSLSTGGHIEYIQLATNLVGHSAPLTAYSGGQISDDRRTTPEGAVGLAAMYMGTISASRLHDLFRAVTELPVQVREFTGDTIPISWPARLGSRLNRLLGHQCYCPEAGVEVVIEGGSDPEAREWAMRPIRRQSLKLLATSFIGSPCPKATIFLLLNADNVPSAALDGQASLGCLAVLGKPQYPKFITLV